MLITIFFLQLAATLQAVACPSRPTFLAIGKSATVRQPAPYNQTALLTSSSAMTNYHILSGYFSTPLAGHSNCIDGEIENVAFTVYSSTPGSGKYDSNDIRFYSLVTVHSGGSYQICLKGKQTGVSPVEKFCVTATYSSSLNIVFLIGELDMTQI